MRLQCKGKIALIADAAVAVGERFIVVMYSL